MLIPVVSFDPSLSNVGIARAVIETDTFAIKPISLRLSETEPQDKKVVRKNSDDIRRASEHLAAMRQESQGCFIGFAEVPHGSQSARAMASYGVSIGILAASTVPLIQVRAEEVKLAAVGTRTASKEEMIEWATELYPELNWFKMNRKGVTSYTAKNEHLADAIAAIHAGVKLDEFRKLVAGWHAAQSAGKV